MIQKIKILLMSIVLVGLVACDSSPKGDSKAETKIKGDGTVTFYFARHGKTMLNTLDRVQGWADTPLTPQGVEVAEFLGVGLKDVPLSAAYSSDLGRARQTARIVLDAKGQKDLTVIEVPGLRETNFGKYEGDLNFTMWTDAAKKLGYKSNDALVKDFPNKPNLLSDVLSTVKSFDTLGMAEDLQEVKARGQKAIREIAQKEAENGGGNILVVSHGMALGIFLSDIDDSGKKATTGHMGNAAVCKVIYKDGKFSLESYGDMSYVEKGKKEIAK